MRAHTKKPAIPCGVRVYVPLRMSAKAILAEGVGFEPTLRITVNQISSLAHSTSLPPFQANARGKRKSIALFFKSLSKASHCLQMHDVPRRFCAGGYCLPRHCSRASSFFRPTVKP